LVVSTLLYCSASVSFPQVAPMLGNSTTLVGQVGLIERNFKNKFGPPLNAAMLRLGPRPQYRIDPQKPSLFRRRILENNHSLRREQRPLPQSTASPFSFQYFTVRPYATQRGLQVAKSSLPKLRKTKRRPSRNEDDYFDEETEENQIAPMDPKRKAELSALLYYKQLPASSLKSQFTLKVSVTHRRAWPEFHMTYITQ